MCEGRLIEITSMFTNMARGTSTLTSRASTEHRASSEKHNYTKMKTNYIQEHGLPLTDLSKVHYLLETSVCITESTKLQLTISFILVP